MASLQSGNSVLTHPSRSFSLALVTIISAIFLFDLQGAIIKHMGQQYPVSQIMVFRNLFGLIPGMLVLYLSADWKAQGRPFVIDKWPLAWGRGAMLISAQLCFYFSLTQLELATATTLAFAGPVFVTTLSIPLLGHRVGWVRGFAVLCGFGGVVAVMQPAGDAFSPQLLLPVAAALFYAFSSLTARFFDESIPTALINLYSAFSTFLGSCLLMLVLQSYTPVASLQDWMLFLLMGLVGGCAVLLLITAYRMWEPSSLSPFEYFGIPFSFILGYVFFDEAPIERLFPGVLLIVGGGLLVVWRERQLAAKKSKAD